MANVAIVHGGQGKVQNAMAAGTPIVGIPFQLEQNWNIQAVVYRGAGIKLLGREWKADAIAAAVSSVLNDPSYKEGVQDVQAEMKKSNGSAMSAEKILDFALAKKEAVAY